MIDTRPNRLDKSYVGAPSHWMPYGAVSMTPDMHRNLGVHLDNVVECAIHHKLANGHVVTHGDAWLAIPDIGYAPSALTTSAISECGTC